MNTKNKYFTNNSYVKNFYNNYVKNLKKGYEYQRWYSSKVSENHYLQTKTTLLRIFRNSQKYNSILEIGSGAGTFTKILSTYCKSLTAVDISAEMINIAKNNDYGSTNIRFINSDFLEFKAGSQSFDIIVLIRCYEYFNEKVPAIEKINKILKKNGKFIIITKNPYYLGKIFRRKNENDKILHNNKISPMRLESICIDYFKGGIIFRPAVFNLFFIPIYSLRIRVNNYFFNIYRLSNKIPKFLMPFIESYVITGQKD